jgi:arginyl-tRNA synthetase
MSETYDLFADFRGRVLAALDQTGILADVDRDALPMAAITVEPPRDESHGDLSTNAAMVLGQAAEIQSACHRFGACRNPPDADTDINGVDVAGPGFINLRVAPAFWQGVLARVLRKARVSGATCSVRPKVAQNQCGICLGQPDRTDACRPLPRRGGRGCAWPTSWKPRAIR